MLCDGSKTLLVPLLYVLREFGTNCYRARPSLCLKISIFQNMWYFTNRTVRRDELAANRCGFGVGRETPLKWRWRWEVKVVTTPVLLTVACTSQSCRGIIKYRFLGPLGNAWFNSLKWGLRIYISSKFLSETDATDLSIRFENCWSTWNHFLILLTQNGQTKDIW